MCVICVFCRFLIKIFSSDVIKICAAAIFVVCDFSVLHRLLSSNSATSCGNKHSETFTKRKQLWWLMFVCCHESFV